MSSVSEIISEKDSRVLTIDPDAEVLDAVRKMNQARIGALVVTEEHRVVGMFTERDVLRLVAAVRDLASLQIREVMSRDVVVTHPSADVDEIQQIMKNRRVRHVPVTDDKGMLVGLISMGDVNAHCVMNQARQLENLNDYIYGRV